MWLDIAERLATESHAMRAKVGAVFVSPEGVVSTGINGMPEGMTNVCENVLDDGSLATKPEVSHAEENLFGCLMRQGVSTKGGALFITLAPCLHCSKIIVQAGIKDVYYRDSYRDISGIIWLKENGINVEKVVSE